MGRGPGRLPVDGDVVCLVGVSNALYVLGWASELIVSADGVGVGQYEEGGGICSAIVSAVFLCGLCGADMNKGKNRVDLHPRCQLPPMARVGCRRGSRPPKVCGRRDEPRRDVLGNGRDTCGAHGSVDDVDDHHSSRLCRLRVELFCPPRHGCRATDAARRTGRASPDGCRY